LEDHIEPGKGPFSAAEREIVVAWIRAGVARNEIARRTGRGGQTVSTVAKQEGLTFVRDVMIPARAAKASDLANRRLILATKAAEKLDKLLDAIDGPLTVYRINSRTGEPVRLKLRQPDPAGKRDLAIAAGIMFDKVAAALKGDDTRSEGRAAIITLIENLRVNVAHDSAPEVIEGEVIESTNR
jgi:hypothetical protein